MKWKANPEQLAFEESLGEDWTPNLELVEIPIGNRTFFFLGVGVSVIACLVIGRILFLSVFEGAFYTARAAANVNQTERVAAPRGFIYDRNGAVIAENRPIFFAILDVKEFIRHPELQEETLASVVRILGTNPQDIQDILKENTSDKFQDVIVLSEDVSPEVLIELKSANLPAVQITKGFQRSYPDGPSLSQVLGYTSFVNRKDLEIRPELTAQDMIGKSGIEAIYDDALRGKVGSYVRVEDSKGNILSEQEKRSPEIGNAIHTTIDAEFQKYFYNRLGSGLRALGRDIGVGIAINPKTGEVLSMVQYPTFDGNIFGAPGHAAEKKEYLTSPLRPLFNRSVSGVYNPGSTIKPLVAIAALAEGVISPDKELYSPGFLDVPNRYDPEHPSRFVDWRPQGWVDVHDALAQSSNVYFYLVGGGSPQQGSRGEVLDGQKGITGLGISRLSTWWQKFGLGQKTGIDLPSEATGVLPGPDTKKDSWLLGDTYNVSIGQGNLLITPIQLVSYIGAVANGGKVFEPYLVSDNHEAKVNADLTQLSPHIREIQEGMRNGVTSGLGTSRLLKDLPFAAAGKTGSAQVKNNTEQNAFFVGYAPYEDPQIAIVVLIENSREGSANTLPIANDVLNWYYEHRIKK